MKIARVFPRKTSMSPTDPDAYFGTPDLFTPKDYDEVHVSVTFTWDIIKGLKLGEAWRPNGKVVKVGGCAFGDRGEEFVAGMYLRKGITITSRGCPFNCDFCFVPRREGNIRELPIVTGHVIQDNNILACSKNHIRKVFRMLKTQKAIQFKGGLDAKLLKGWHIDAFRSLAIKELWFSCDHKNAIHNIEKIAPRLTPYFDRHKLRCYVLIGDDMTENEDRLRRVRDLGFDPFAQLFRDADNKIGYSPEWKQFARLWCRPALYHPKDNPKPL